MQIRCSVCDYAREVDQKKIPSTAEFATCPKCRHRFQFRVLDHETMEHQPPTPEPDPKHADVWDAVDSLHDRWQERDRQDSHNDVQDDNSEAQGYPPHGPQPDDIQNDVAIPWENPHHFGYGQSFVRTTLWAFFQPSSFFATLSRRPALLPALLYYLIFGVVQYVLNVAWTYTAASMPFLRDPFIEARGEEFFNKLVTASLAGSLDPATLLSVPFILVIQVFFTAGLLHLFIKLTAPGADNFALSFKVVTYAAASSILAVLPIVGVFLAPLWYLVILVLGCRNAFRLTWGKTAIAMSPIFILMVLGTALQVVQLTAL